MWQWLQQEGEMSDLWSREETDVMVVEDGGRKKLGNYHSLQSLFRKVR